jgi:low affinity Fe/Cu permease
MQDLFARFSRGVARVVGSPWAFILSIGIILVWAMTGPALGFSATWQLVINTSTTIITFLMVFIIQNTQNRDARAIHVKLDELIHAVQEAHDDVVDIEEATEEELAKHEDHFREVREAVAGGR